jgi:hypothetical protein
MPFTGQAGHVVALADGAQVVHVAGAFHAGTHRVVVVLDDEDHRQLPGHGHVEGLVQHALADRTITHHAQGHVVLAAVLVGEGDAGAQADLPAHDAVATEEVALLVEVVHAAALALARTGQFAVELGHHVLRGAQHQRMAMITVAGDDAIGRANGGDHTREDGLLPDVEVAETAELLHGVELARISPRNGASASSP